MKHAHLNGIGPGAGKGVRAELTERALSRASNDDAIPAGLTPLSVADTPWYQGAVAILSADGKEIARVRGRVDFNAYEVARLIVNAVNAEGRRHA